MIRENYRKERDDYKIDLACGPQEIELFIIKNAPARVNYPEALGLRHLAFKVESVDETVKELNGKGIETEPVRLDDYTGKKMTFFKDPDGLPLELHGIICRTLGSDLLTIFLHRRKSRSVICSKRKRDRAVSW